MTALAVAGCAAIDRSASASEPPIRVRYGAAADHFGDLYLPGGDATGLPVLVMVHGGAWQEKYDLGYTGTLAADLVPHGVAVWNIEYRRVGGGGGWPTTFADVDDATEALATVVQERAGGRLDLDRVHVAGHSAGGHLAAWLTARRTLAAGAPGADPKLRLRSATIMAGVLDLKRAATTDHDMFVRSLLGGMPDEYPERYRIASPIEHLPVGLPVTALHGDADHTVSVDQSRTYVAAARAAGDPADLEILPGIGHGDFGRPDSPAWAAAKKIIVGHLGV